MSDDKNLPDQDLDWVIALGLSQPLVGVLHQWIEGQPPPGIERRWLEPVYALGASAEPVIGIDPQTRQPVHTGKVQINHAGSPILLLPSVKRLNIPDSVAIIRVRDLSPADRRVIMNAAKQGETAAMEIRLGQSGLQAVPAGAKLPPPQLVR